MSDAFVPLFRYLLIYKIVLQEVLRVLEEHMLIQAVLKRNARAKLGAAIKVNIVDKLLRFSLRT